MNRWAVFLTFLGAVITALAVLLGEARPVKPPAPAPSVRAHEEECTLAASIGRWYLYRCGR